ncbi:MAG TPA: hypothetical protein VF677_05620 [Flavobacterium sp.]
MNIFSIFLHFCLNLFQDKTVEVYADTQKANEVLSWKANATLEE